MRSLWLTVLAVVVSTSAAAQIAVSANDGKQRAADQPNEARTPDTISVLDITRSPPRVLATIAAPASMIGPPASVALSGDGRLAIVTVAQRIDATGALVPDDLVQVIDLGRPVAARVTQTAHAGGGAGGVAINAAGTLALIANSTDDTVSVFTIRSGQLSPAGSVRLDAKSNLRDIAFTRDGKNAYVLAQGSDTLVRLAVDGTNVTHAGDIALGVQPYSMALDRAAGLAYVTDLGGRKPAPDTPGPRTGTIAIFDLKAGRVVGEVNAGVTPEYVTLSPSGRFLQATLINGSNASTKSPNYNDHGLVRIFAAKGGTLTQVAEANTSRWCQGAVWTRDERRIILQCGAPKQLETYRFDGKTLARDDGGTLPLDARPGAIATAQSR